MGNKYDYLGIFMQRKLSLTKVVGSDYHKVNKTGRDYSWVKRGTPSIEFELVIKEHPRVKKAKKYGIHVSYEALAQHYEMKTDLLDLTSDIMVATFFATNKYESKLETYRPIKEGIGCLRMIPNMFESDKKLMVFGAQPFERPQRQCAYRYKLSKNDNFAKSSTKVLFKQKEEYGEIIRKAFKKNKNSDLLPKEDITEVAKKIKKDMVISEKSVDLLCGRNNIDREYVCNILSNNNYNILNRVCRRLSEQQIKDLERRLPKNIYKGVDIRHRLMFIPSISD